MNKNTAISFPCSVFILLLFLSIPFKIDASCFLQGRQFIYEKDMIKKGYMILGEYKVGNIREGQWTLNQGISGFYVQGDDDSLIVQLNFFATHDDKVIFNHGLRSHTGKPDQKVISSGIPSGLSANEFFRDAGKQGGQIVVDEPQTPETTSQNVKVEASYIFSVVTGLDEGANSKLEQGNLAQCDDTSFTLFLTDRQLFSTSHSDTALYHAEAHGMRISAWLYVKPDGTEYVLVNIDDLPCGERCEQSNTLFYLATIETPLTQQNYIESAVKHWKLSSFGEYLPDSINQFMGFYSSYDNNERIDEYIVQRGEEAISEYKWIRYLMYTAARYPGHVVLTRSRLAGEQLKRLWLHYTRKDD